MSDEEKSIEEIIAELEGLEKEAKEEEQEQVARKDEEEPVELTMEEPREDIQRVETHPPLDEVQAEKSDFEDIFAEKPQDEPRLDISDDRRTEELTLEEPLEGLSLEEPVVVPAKGDEGVAELTLEDSEAAKQRETGELEISPETDEISLEEVTPEGPRDEATIDLSSKSAGEEESFEEFSLEKGEDRAVVDEPSFDDVFDATGDGSPEAVQDEVDVRDDQTLSLAPEDISQERDAATAHGGLSDEKFHDELPSEAQPSVTSAGGPPTEPPDDKQGGLPPDEPPSRPRKVRKPLQWSRVAILLGIFLVAIVSYGIFVWPTLYEYRWVKSGDIKYQVKINRITKTQHYFDAGSWHQGSVPLPMPKAARHKIEIKPTEEKKEAQTEVKEPTTVAKGQEEPTGGVAKTPGEEAKVVPAEAKPAEQQVATPPQKPAQVAEKKEEAPVPAKEMRAEEPKKEEKVAVEVPVKETRQEQKIAVKPAGDGNYVIQLSSMRLEEFADELTAALKKKGWPVMQDTVMDKNSEPWYRVFVGGFATRPEAAAFMKEKFIQKAYPGSYIRSTAPHAAAD
ncbi:MAG: SPOR domain-containing protein [Deltaproteobacteria bacterium]|nr:SPOR domain-containing protein [Deltaproteobacteria bacterium]MBN2688646.1 SPOR domain-containing protein [Deltaproteobacteria bacterium]